MTFIQTHLQRLQDLLNATSASLSEANFENKSDLIRTDRSLEEAFAVSIELENYLLPSVSDEIVVVIHGGKDATRADLDTVLAEAREAVIEAGTLAPDEDPCEGCEYRDTCPINAPVPPVPAPPAEEGIEIEENDDDDDDDDLEEEEDDPDAWGDDDDDDDDDDEEDWD